MKQATTKSFASKRIRPKIIKKERKEEHLMEHGLLFALQKISKVLTAETSLQRILEDMATTVAKALGAKWVNFWELTPDKQATHIVASYGMTRQYMEQSRAHPIRLGTAWIGRAVKTKQAWSTSDIQYDPKLPGELGETWVEAIKKQNVRALICVPIISGKEAVGGICVYYTKPHEFTDFEMRLLTVVSSQAATAIMNSKIFGQLEAERNKTLAMVNSLQDGLIVYDLEGRIIGFNPRAEELLWVARGKVLGKKSNELSIEDTALKNVITISALAIGDFENKEILITAPQRIFLIITQVPLRDAKNQKLGSMRVLHDITAAKETEELKSGFISVASHQLRTPLSGMKWGIDTLRKAEAGPISEEQSQLLAKLYSANEQMINLINDLLDSARIEEGRFGYIFHLIDVVPLAEKILAMFTAQIKQRNLEVTFHKPSRSVPSISADAQKLEMAVQNVIENAIKYTVSGGRVDIAFHAGAATLIMDVKDTGIGIPRDQQKFLFTKFFRAPNAIRFQPEGSGLGLWIANEIMKRHNARISVESEENKGSIFSLQWPLEAALMPKGKIEGL